MQARFIFTQNNRNLEDAGENHLQLNVRRVLHSVFCTAFTELSSNQL